MLEIINELEVKGRLEMLKKFRVVIGVGLDKNVYSLETEKIL